MQALNDKKTKVMIMSDINIDLASQTNYVSDYNLLLQSNFFFSLITKPARVTNSSKTIIDHVLTNDTDSILTPGVSTYSISDHYPIFCTISNPTFKTTKKNMTYSFRNIALVNGGKFRSNLYSVLLPLYDKLIHSYSNITANSFNEHFNQMMNAILAVINQHAPLQNATRKQKRLFQKPYITGLITSIKHKQRLYRTHFLKGNSSERQFYKKYANKLTRLKNLSKKMYYKEALNVNKSNSKELWKIINSVILNKRANNPIVKKLTVNNIDFEEPNFC